MALMAQLQRRRPGVCFACGKPGHWRHECMVNNGSSMRMNNTKMSTFYVASNAESSLSLKTTISSVDCNYTKVTNEMVKS